MAFEEIRHRVSVRDGVAEPWNIKSRLTVWEVNMRLALGFCGQLAKAPFFLSVY